MTTTANKSNGARVLSPVERVRASARIFPITVEKYHEMIEKGIVAQDSTVELLRGMLVRKDRSVVGEDLMGHSPLHSAFIALVSNLIPRINSDKCHVRIQLPISCPPDNEPEPDAAIVRGVARDYVDHLPGVGEIFCVIEGAHSSLERDREDKLPIYAGAGIPQYIIANLQNQTFEVYTDPDPQSEQYRTKVTVDRNGTVVLRLPSGELSVSVSEILP